MEANSFLSARLRQLREEAGLSVRQLADITKISKSKISAMETGQTAVKMAQVDIILEALGAPLHKVFTVDSAFRVLRSTEEIIPLCNGISELRFFEDRVLPLPLQTFSYGRALLYQFFDYRHPELALKLKNREELQNVCLSKKFRCVVSPEVLSTTVGDNLVVKDQRNHLKDFNDKLKVVLPNPDLVGLLPNNFTVFDDKFLFCETACGCLISGDQETVKKMIKKFEIFWKYGKQVCEVLKDN